MKPRVAFFDFASCEGCQLQVVNLEVEMLDVLAAIDIVNFREAISERSDDYDIAFIEGSVTRDSDIPRLKKIRETAKVLVAMGACAATGGVNYIKNFKPSLDWCKAEVYGKDKDMPHLETGRTYAIDELVKVDFYIYGCPIHKDELVKVVKALLLGKLPEIPNYPVCVECKRNENVCVFELGQFCLGPVTRAGCGAWCTTNGHYCYGCRGLMPDPNVNAATEVLQKYGLTLEQAIGRFQTFVGKGNAEVRS